jgi:hypothetical protein
MLPVALNPACAGAQNRVTAAANATKLPRTGFDEFMLQFLIA